MLHSLKNLSEYNLFRNPNNIFLKTALLVDTQTIKLETFEQIIPDLLQVYRYEYGSEHKDGSFGLIPLQSIIFDNQKSELKISPNIYNNYCIHYKNDKLNVILDPQIGGILDTFFAPNPNEKFGAIIQSEIVEFNVWSPSAGKMNLILFDENQNRIKHPEIPLQKQENGIWTLRLNKNDFQIDKLDGLFYQYEVFAYGKKMRALDPYAKSMAVFSPNDADKIGKAALISEKNTMLSHFKNSDILDTETEAVFYEINVRDFTIQPRTVEKEIAGTFTGFAEKIDYLKSLNISHVQLMPVHKAYTQHEKDREYTGRKAPISNYNWGYDPMNYFTLEGRYSVNPQNPYTRIEELQNLTESLHTQGIGIIFDVVFNHTYILETFENIAPGCYYRHQADQSVSGQTGAGATLESRRKVVRKLMADSMKYMIQTFGADGFRFDLMSFHDHQTMQYLREEVGKFYNPENIFDLILHGEAWNFTDLPQNIAYTKTNPPQTTLHIALFNDVFRDSATGRNEKPGFVQGDLHEFSNLGSGIVGALQSFRQENLPFDDEQFYLPYALFARSPEECINYLAIHDGLTLWDKIHIAAKNTDKKTRVEMAKLAAAILFTSQGKVIWHGGDEIFRSKPLSDYDLEQNRALASEHFDEEENSNRFHENSYQSADFTNAFRWDRLHNKYAAYAAEMKKYVADLILMRRLWRCFRYENAQNIIDGLKFIADKKTETINKSKFYHFTDNGFNQLTINFFNGPKNETAYLTGEIHSGEANPKENPFQLIFDAEGSAQIHFTREQILNFDIKKWDSSRRLNFKLTKTPASWNFPGNTYSSYGFNSICPRTVEDDFVAEINLGIKDFWFCNESSNSTNHVVYLLNNTIELSNFTKKKQFIPEFFMVIYNTGHNDLKIEIPEEYRNRKLSVLVDANSVASSMISDSELESIPDTNVIIDADFVLVRRISAAIIAIF